jgi:Carboxypeptidase regulatory-like domain/TonB-dependent Receptor Plug Domain
MFSIKSHWSKLLYGLSVLLLASGPAMAQTVTGTISGTVVDPTGQVIMGAMVTLINERVNDKRTLTTNEDGAFNFSTLQPGIYTIKIERQGFRTFQRTNNVLSANEYLSLGRLTLDVGELTEVVTTQAEGAVVETESSTLTARLTAAQISQISTKGRDITSLLRLLPGVSYGDDVESVGDGNGTGLPIFSGLRARSNAVSIDGINGISIGGSNNLAATISQDAVEEVKLLRNNYSAEFGNQGGAQINIVTKSGKKEYSGSAYYFLRNEALNANGFFNNRQGLPRGLYRHNIWGFNLGGPVQIPWLFRNKERKKLFFFYSLERPHTITPQPARFVTVPTERERQGDFSQSFTGINLNTGVLTKAFVRDPLLPGSCNANDQSACFRDPSRATADNPLGLNIIPRDRLNANGVALLNFFPLPNQPGGFNAALRRNFNYVVQKSADVPKQGQVIRVDFKPTEKDSFYVKAQWWRANNEGFDTSGWPGGDTPDGNRWGISSQYYATDKNIAINWVRIISPTIVNEVTVGARRALEAFIPSDGEIERVSRSRVGYTLPQFFPANNELGAIPLATSWGGLSNTSVANINWISRWGEAGNDYVLPSISNDITINHRNHNFKMGIYFERLRNGEAPGSNWSGTYNFSSNDSNFTSTLGNTGHPYANALTGSFRSYTESASRPHTDLERSMIQWYAQDQWKTSKRLTLSYGVRMGWFSHWRQRNDDASVFDPARFDPAKAPILYRPHCTVATPLGTACPNNNRRAIDPRNPSVLLNANLVGAFVPGTGDRLNGIILGTDPDYPRGFKDPAPIQVEPRFGLAWSLSDNDKTVLRAHGGVYHSTKTAGTTAGDRLASNPPFQRNVTIDFGTMDDLPTLLGTALDRPTNINMVERNSKTPTIYNYSIGIQQDIGFKTIVEVSYVGSLSRHLGETHNINGVPDGARFLDLHPENRNPFSAAGALGNEFLRPFQGYQDINYTSHSTTSNYNGLQVQVNRRYTSRFQFGIAYTWAKALEYANDDTTNVNFPRPYHAFNYGPTDNDQTHIFTANYIWDVPGLGRRWNNRFVKSIFDNWQLSGTTSFVSGRPKNVTVSYQSDTVGGIDVVPNDITGGHVNARPLVICDPQREVSMAADGTPVFVDDSCFLRPSRGEIGNSQRNGLRRPGIIASDLALFKNIRLREKFQLQFRWETYNLFNHTNFSDIDAALTLRAGLDGQITQTNSRFGQPTTARPPRVMQGSLRINF